MVVNACLLGHIKDPYERKTQKAVRNRVESYSRSVNYASLGLMYMAREMYRDVTHIKIFEIPEEFFNKTFIGDLIFGTGEMSMRNERLHALHEHHSNYRFNGTR